MYFLNVEKVTKNRERVQVLQDKLVGLSFITAMVTIARQRL